MGKLIYTFHARLEKEVYARVKEESEATGMSMNALINSILAERLVGEVYTMSIRVLHSGDGTTYEILVPERMGGKLQDG